jgi:hypothetical protein
MPRNYNLDPGSRTATTGKAYEPSVTPNRRDDDDTSVIGGRNAGRDAKAQGQFGPDSEKEGTRIEKAAAPRSAAERELDDATRYDEDGRKEKVKH